MPIKAASRYRVGVTAGKPLAKAIGAKPTTLFRSAGLERKSGGRYSYKSARSEKQNLESTFSFGEALLDITKALSVEAIRGPAPILIKFRNGKTYHEWSGLPKKPLTEIAAYGKSSRSVEYDIAVAQRQRWEADRSNKNRSPAINIRIEAELLIFIAQTGMNQAQAWDLKIGEFRFESYQDGYVVRRYKARRLGDVEFSVYSEYRTHFEQYLSWRNEIFPSNSEELLFPFINRRGEVRRNKLVFTRIMDRFIAIGVKFIGPQLLRQTRINWLLRQSRNPALTAEMHSHTVETLLDDYQKPSHQIAIIEISRFWQNNDPALRPPGPGFCVEKTPVSLPGTPVGAPQPDCHGADGCLFCINQRDLDTFDHVWSLASLRYLKSLEVARDHAKTVTVVRPKHPALLAVERITHKIDWFAASSELRSSWVEEALERMKEEKHHKRWAGWIILAELIT